ncbi:glycosyl transferase family 90 [Euzebyella marina]|uniref:glycosyltransferase family 90 protein n=1 Tax=Euzebyella marina TaxID=1761453 RepID=UPI001CE33FD5|nr:glycosyltransferase family 90 protein [Euzebyella marina]
MDFDDINAFYYAKNFGKNALPKFYFRHRYRQLMNFKKTCDPTYLNYRVDYYLKHNQPFELPQNSVAVKDFKRTKGTGYYLDLKEFLHYFSPHVRFAYHFGDETHINPQPTLFKARPLYVDNANSVLFKLNKRRHFKWVKDALGFEDKKKKVVWRGRAHQKQRRDFVEKFWNHPSFDVGLITPKQNDLPLHRGFMDINAQLEHQFIACIEGYDVATNLKWAMSSNSLCIMPKPTCETWFMEGTLKARVHYVEVEADFSDMEEKMEYYSKNPSQAKEIIKNAHEHIASFKNKKMEDLICFLVLEKYAQLSGQENYLRFQ